MTDYKYLEEQEVSKLLGQYLIDNNLKIAVAESLTGGMVAGTLVDIPGISKVFMEGIVSYSNDSKINRLGVKRETIDKYGAVSVECAKEMAEGLICNDIVVSLSTTGIAGPTGGSPEKPVGTVCFGFCFNGKTKTEKMVFSGNRQEIREKSTNYAIYKLYLYLCDKI